MTKVFFFPLRERERGFVFLLRMIIPPLLKGIGEFLERLGDREVRFGKEGELSFDVSGSSVFWVCSDDDIGTVGLVKNRPRAKFEESNGTQRFLWEPEDDHA